MLGCVHTCICITLTTSHERKHCQKWPQLMEVNCGWLFYHHLTSTAPLFVSLQSTIIRDLPQMLILRVWCVYLQPMMSTLLKSRKSLASIHYVPPKGHTCQSWIIEVPRRFPWQHDEPHIPHRPWTWRSISSHNYTQPLHTITIHTSAYYLSPTVKSCVSMGIIFMDHFTSCNIEWITVQHIIYFSL